MMLVVVNEKSRSAEMNVVAVGFFKLFGLLDVHYFLLFIETSDFELVFEFESFFVETFALGSLGKTVFELVV